MTHAQQVTLIGEALGRTIAYEELEPVVARKALSPYAPFEDWEAHLTDAAERLIGHPLASRIQGEPHMKPLSVLLSLLLAIVLVPAPPAAAARHGWSGSWAASPQRPAAGMLAPNWSEAGFRDQSLRQVVRISTGGPRLRLRLSNAYGRAPLRLSGVSVARTRSGASIVPGTVRPVRFAKPVIPVGGEAVSQPVRLPTRPLDQLTVTMYFNGPTGPATYHDAASTLSYRAQGDRRSDARGTAFTSTTSSWYYLSGVDVLSGARGAVVAFGDSVTDGTGSTPGADRRYPDALAKRLASSGRRLGVLNAGISGNRVLRDSDCFGEKATARFRRDALDRPGVRTVIVMEGINDIGFPGVPRPCFRPNDEPVTAEQLIDGHRALIRAARARGVRIIGGTLVPFEGSFYFTAEKEKVRDAVNAWIRTSGEYDGVVDFERALTAPGRPDRLRPEFNVRAGQAGDWLHPNDAGLAAMAAAVDLADL